MVASFFVEQLLDAVERWAYDYWLVRETTIGLDHPGRLDGLLIPIRAQAHCMRVVKGAFFERIRLVGLEVKITRQDFFRGVKSGQLDRYAGCVAGVYVVNPAGVIKAKEVPAGVGQIVCRLNKATRQWVASCRRHPTYRNNPIPPDAAWRLLFEWRHETARREAAMNEDYEENLRRIGRLASDCVFGPLHEAAEKIRRRLEQANAT